jgi:hypothetical protein
MAGFFVLPAFPTLLSQNRGITGFAYLRFFWFHLPLTLPAIPLRLRSIPGLLTSAQKKVFEVSGESLSASHKYFMHAFLHLVYITSDFYPGVLRSEWLLYEPAREYCHCSGRFEEDMDSVHDENT